MLKNRNDYKEYVPGSSFAEAFETNKIPMMQMAHLRNLDYPISRHLSYERTVDEFLLQLAVNDSLQALKVRRDLVILLNEEGALIRENGKWILLFTRLIMKHGGWRRPCHICLVRITWAGICFSVQSAVCPPASR